MGTPFAYLADLGQRLGNNWNRFWFTPSDPELVCLLRMACGLATVTYLLSHSRDLVGWFGPHGLLPGEVVRRLLDQGDSGAVFRWSYLFLIEDPQFLWAAHLLGLCIALAFTAGWHTRVTCILTLFIVLSYIHRAPMLTGMWEPILSMMLLYLCIAPCGARWSLDARRQGRRHLGRPSPPLAPAVAATICVRLMQVHLSGFYLVMGLTKLAGETWWFGEAVWWLIARSESRLVDLTMLHRSILVINLWTHAMVLFELLFAVLIWNRSLRPLLLAMGVFAWISVALLTGQLGFCGMMVIANFSFLDPWRLRSPADGLRGAGVETSR